MLWVYDHYKYFYSYSAGIDFTRQNVMSKVDPSAVGAKSNHPSQIYAYLLSLSLS